MVEVEDYWYGFNGFEKDDEIKGDGNSYTTEFRQYDPRVARWLSLDPKTHHEYSPYSAFDNNPIYYVDPEGADSEGENKDDLNDKEIPDQESNKESEISPPQNEPGKETLKTLKIENKTLEEQLDVISSEKMQEGDYLEGKDVNLFNPYASVAVDKLKKLSSNKLKVERTVLGMKGIDSDATLTFNKGKEEILRKVDGKNIREKVSGYWMYTNGFDIDGEKKVFVTGDKIYKVVDGKLQFFKDAKKR